MAKELIGVFEVGNKKPSEMTDEELDAWANVLAEEMFAATKKQIKRKNIS